VKPEEPDYLPSARRPHPGRPRKAESGHVSGTGALQPAKNTGQSGGPLASLTIAPLAPRLLDLHAAAAYLGVSTWTVRDLEGGGMLKRVRLPLAGGGEVRKLLFCREDLDRLVENSKDGTNG
jgi:hypothetical protein